MKKLTYLVSLLALVFCAASCQDKGLDANQDLVSISAVISDPVASRVTLADNETTLRPSWTVGDEVIGFDEAGTTFTFTVTDVVAGRATMSAGGYAPVDGRKVYAIYAPGKSASDISESQLTVSIATQEGLLDENAPFLMCATAVVDGTSISLSFENKVAVVGLKKFKVNPANAALTVDHLLLDGAIAAGTFQVVAGNLELVPAGAPATITAAGTWETDATGLYDAPVYFAVLPTADANLELHAASGSDSYVNLASIAQTTLEAGYYYRMSKILDAVADVAGVKYASIDDAWAVANAAASDVTVTLLANCTAASSLILNNSVSGTGAVTLDLNGKTLSTTYGIRVESGRDLTVTDISSAVLAEQGSISSSYSGGQSIYVDASTLTFAGGTLSNTTAKYPIYANGASTLILSGGKVHANNYSALYVGADATVTVSGTELLSENRYGIYNLGTLTVSAGSVETKSESSYPGIYVTSGAQLTVTGGTFKSNGTTVIQTNGTSSLTEVSGGYFSRETDGELFTVSNSGESYVFGGRHDRAVNSNRTRSSGGTYVRCNAPNDEAATKAAYPFMVGNYTRKWNLTKGTYTYWHSTAACAATQANGATEDVKITAREATLTSTGAFTLNNPSHTITFDINGQTVGKTSSGAFITVGGSVIITDSGDPKGVLQAAYSPVIDITAAGADVTLDGIEIKCTKEKGSAWNSDALLNMSSTGGSLTIQDSKVYSTMKLSVLRGETGTITIDNSEISSGTETEGWYTIIAVGSAAITVNSGSFYTSGTGTSSSCHIGNSAGTLTVNDGYFYSNGRTVSAGNKSYYNKITLNGGYYNQLPSVPSSGTGQDHPNYGAGLSMQAITPVAYTPVTVGSELSYGYQVKADPGEGEASLDEPVANYGGAQTGINF